MFQYIVIIFLHCINILIDFLSPLQLFSLFSHTGCTSFEHLFKGNFCDGWLNATGEHLVFIQHVTENTSHDFSITLCIHGFHDGVNHTAIDFHFLESLVLHRLQHMTHVFSRAHDGKFDSSPDNTAK